MLCDKCEAMGFSKVLVGLKGGHEARLPLQVAMASGFLRDDLTATTSLALSWTIEEFNDFLRRQEPNVALQITEPWHLCEPERFFLVTVPGSPKASSSGEPVWVDNPAEHIADDDDDDDDDIFTPECRLYDPVPHLDRTRRFRTLDTPMHCCFWLPEAMIKASPILQASSQIHMHTSVLIDLIHGRKESSTLQLPKDWHLCHADKFQLTLHVMTQAELDDYNHPSHLNSVVGLLQQRDFNGLNSGRRASWMDLCFPGVSSADLNQALKILPGSVLKHMFTQLNQIHRVPHYFQIGLCR